MRYLATGEDGFLLELKSDPGRLGLCTPAASRFPAVCWKSLAGTSRASGAVQWVHWDSGTAHLLPRLLCLPDGSARTHGPLFLAQRCPVPARVGAGRRRVGRAPIGGARTGRR